MNELHFPFGSESITLYRKMQVQLKQLKSEQRREMGKRLNVARQRLISSFAESTLLRASNAQNAWTESLVWFWFNHFNVFWQKGLVGVALPDYVDEIIRPHAQGGFRDLLLGTITHPAMLIYLDNAKNSVGHINENYARELMELHTLGVNGGYTQEDVKEVARILTGVGLRPMRPVRTPPQLAALVREHGEFMFDPRKHDRKDKQVLGQKIKGNGFDEVETLVDILVSHPATARHIAGKLCLFLLGDEPPADAVLRATKIFSESKGDIAKTIAAIQQDKPASGAKRSRTFKDPYRYVMSAVRLLSADKPLKHARPLVRWLSTLGQPLFGRHTPDGYSLYGRDWVSAGQLTQRFELAKEMVNVMPRLLEKNQTTEDILAQPSVKSFIASLGDLSRTTLSKADDADERLALLLSSPEFMYW